jgi:peptide/nickel transport system permease protein
MGAYIFRRLIQGLIILILVTMLVFLLMRLLPGDPLMVYLSSGEIQNMTQADIAVMRHDLGLDRSLAVQYYNWAKNLLHGDMGTSFILHEKVAPLIKDSIPITAYIGSLAFIIGSVLGIFFGAICALRRGTWIDTVVTVLANLGITVPAFWVGILLIYFLALKLQWLPVSGYTSPFEDVSLSLRQIVMPVFCLAIGPVAGLARQTRSSMLEVVQQDYIRTAWSKGLRERMIVVRHQIKNALIPVVTIMGMQVGVIFGGSVLIETVFNIPGVGRLMTNAVFQQDYQIVQAGVLIMATVVILSNLLVDITYGWLDPRIRYT